MTLTAGTIIISKPLLEDANFEEVVILITEYNHKGAMGFVINQLFARTLNELEEFKTGIPFRIYEGGPMDKEHLYFVHSRSDLIEGGEHISGNLYLGGDFKKAVMLLNHKTILEKDIKIFIGYCGWDNGQLETELEEGSWLIANANDETVFAADTPQLWQQLKRATA